MTYLHGISKHLCPVVRTYSDVAPEYSRWTGSRAILTAAAEGPRAYVIDGFLSPDGKPTARYHEFRDHSKSAQVLGEALREAYSDIFLIKSNPTSADREAIQGKFKSYHNSSDNVAKLMTSTFLALLDEADISAARQSKTEKPTGGEPKPHAPGPPPIPGSSRASLHYNIQIHLPATKDIEVYNAIFKSIREHLINDSRATRFYVPWTHV